MVRINRPEVSLPRTSPSDPRLGHLLGRDLREADQALAVILGFPSDEGVRRNGGRPGAAQGPVAIRNALYRLAPDARCPAFDRLLGRTIDLGDLEVSGEVEEDQRNLGTVVSQYLQQGVFVVVLGGGHETSYGHFLGYANGGHRVEILNWDAHADVRELAEGRGHSGSPFRQAIEHPSGACRRYTAAGLQPHAVSRSHLNLVQGHGRAVWSGELTPDVMEGIYHSLEPPALVSFDLDAVRQSEAPGVSAPNPGGLSGELWLDAVYRAGRAPAVASADVVELNPRFDRDDQTARLAALTVWWLLRGRAER